MRWENFCPDCNIPTLTFQIALGCKELSPSLSGEKNVKKSSNTTCNGSDRPSQSSIVQGCFPYSAMRWEGDQGSCKLLLSPVMTNGSCRDKKMRNSSTFSFLARRRMIETLLSDSASACVLKTIFREPRWAGIVETFSIWLIVSPRCSLVKREHGIKRLVMESESERQEWFFAFFYIKNPADERWISVWTTLMSSRHGEHKSWPQREQSQLAPKIDIRQQSTL